MDERFVSSRFQIGHYAMQTLHARAVALAGLTALLAVGCGAEQGSPRPVRTPPREPVASSPPQPSGTTNRSLTAHDPPLRFESEGLSVMLRGAFTLEGTVAYQFDNSGAVDFDGSIEAVDLLTGRTAWDTGPGLPARTLSQDARPLIAEFDGRELVIGAVPRTVPGSGTTPDRDETHVIAVDGHDGAEMWTVVLPPAEDPFEVDDAFAQVVAATDEAVVVNVSNTVYVLDPAMQVVRWQRTGFRAADLEGDVVVGLAGPGVGASVPTGVTAFNGTPRWELGPLDDVAMFDAGPGLTQFTGALRTDPNSPRSILVDGRTGAERGALPGRYECRYDDRSATVCADSGFLDSPGTLVGFDTASAERL